MDDSTLRDFLLRLGSIEDVSVRNRIGVVTATSPLTVRVAGGAPIANVQRIRGINFAIGDRVLCQMWQSVLVVIGNITPGDDPWHTIGASGEPGFAPGWQGLVGGYPPGFRRRGDRIQLRGTVAATSTRPAGSTVFTFPSGYAVSQGEVRLVFGSDTPRRLDIGSMVACQTATAAGQWLSLDGLEFDALP